MIRALLSRLRARLGRQHTDTVHPAAPAASTPRSALGHDELAARARLQRILDGGSR